METKNSSWKTDICTLIFATEERGSRKSVLIGKAIKGPIKGFLKSPGGKVEESDVSITTAAVREFKQETNYRAKQIEQTATVVITILEEMRTVTLHVFVCKSWTGKLKCEKSEFEYLRWLNINTLPYHKMAPGDEEWVRRLLRGENLEVQILCGKNRLDVRRIEISILP